MNGDSPGDVSTGLSIISGAMIMNEKCFAQSEEGGELVDPRQNCPPVLTGRQGSKFTVSK